MLSRPVCVVGSRKPFAWLWLCFWLIVGFSFGRGIAVMRLSLLSFESRLSQKHGVTYWWNALVMDVFSIYMLVKGEDPSNILRSTWIYLAESLFNEMLLFNGNSPKLLICECQNDLHSGNRSTRTTIYEYSRCVWTACIHVPRTAANPSIFSDSHNKFVDEGLNFTGKVLIHSTQHITRIPSTNKNYSTARKETKNSSPEVVSTTATLCCIHVFFAILSLC